MPKYQVFVREEKIRTYTVDADSQKQAETLVFESGRNMLERAHGFTETLDSKTYVAESPIGGK